MFRFLIVEDWKPTLMQLKAMLSEEFDGSTVDTAGSVAEGSQCLASSIKEGKTYDAALLDFKLPSSPDEPAQIDHSLCEEVRTKAPGTLVIHMTAFADAGPVLAHIEESHNDPSSPGPVLVSKEDVLWPSVLLKRLKMSLFTREIAMQMDEVFGNLPAADGFGRTAALRRPTVREGGVTHRLAILTQNIEKHWLNLSEPLKQRIRATFVVDTAGDEVRVSLL
jgi:CheY-like chemotaxis protein